MNFRCYQWPVLLCVSVLLSACDVSQQTGDSQTGGMAVPTAPARSMDAQQLTLGQRVFQANCASCHGAQAQGDANWRQRDASGFYPAPPLNGSGHAWHHSLEMLKGVILNGSPQGKGNMPAWQGKINKTEIEATMAWFQSLWPQPVYDAWYEMQQRGK